MPTLKYIGLTAAIIPIAVLGGFKSLGSDISVGTYIQPKADAKTYAMGQKLYARCIGCHAFEYNRTGPMHCGLRGRRAGSLEDYSFSEAMKSSGIVWTEETLDAFLLSPRQAIPGTTMEYAGIKDDIQRHALVLYLLEESISSVRCENE